MIQQNRKENHKKIENNITLACKEITQGNIQAAFEILNAALELDFSYSRVLSGLNYVEFWRNRYKHISSLSDSFEIFETVITHIKQFKKHAKILHRNAAVDHQLYSAFEQLLYSIILRATQDLSHEQDSLLWSGIAYKGMGNLQDAHDNLHKALQLDPSNARILSELADICSLLGNEQLARAFFREAFFIDPQEVDIERLESQFIHSLVAFISAKKGSNTEIIREWIPVYGSAQHIFQVKRELRSVEYGKLRQSIFKNEQKLIEGDTSLEIVPRLLNQYFWLIDYLIINKEEQKKIQEILLKIDSISPEIYEAYTGEKSRQGHKHHDIL